MKIVFIGEAISGFGGMETVIQHVTQTLSNNEFNAQCNIFFFCRNNNTNKKWLKNIDAFYSVSKNKCAFLRRAKHVREFSQWIKQQQPDIVIALDPLSCKLASKARKKAGRSVPLFSWPHFSLDHKKHADCITRADYHLAISSGIRQQMLHRGVAENTIEVIYNPTVPVSVTIPAPSKESVATFLYVGRMKFEGQKRIKDLLDAFSRVPGDWILHIIGDGSDTERCKTYSRELTIDNRITWHGWQDAPWKVVQEQIGHVTALVLTSSFEGFPMTLLEAIAHGIPCVSADCISGPGDIIREGVNGWLYPPGDVSALSGILSTLARGEMQIDPAPIPHSIAPFYSETYFRKLTTVLQSRM